MATVKVIPLALPATVLSACAALAGEPAPLLRVAAYRPKSAGLIQTRLPGTKERLLEKAVAGLSQRVAALGGALTRELRCDHNEKAVTAALGDLAELDLVLVLGASATVDRRDVVPAAIERAGGTVEHLGMPVDPGNLTLLARLGETPVIGLPGSARSPRSHGFDWLLRRIMADVPVGREEIMRMGGRRSVEGDNPTPPAPCPGLATPAPRGTSRAAHCRPGAGGRPVAPHGQHQQAAQ